MSGAAGDSARSGQVCQLSASPPPPYVRRRNGRAETNVQTDATGTALVPCARAPSPNEGTSSDDEAEEDEAVDNGLVHAALGVPPAGS